MEYVVKWLFEQFTYLIDFALSVKIISDFSLLHLVLAVSLVSLLIKFITFGNDNSQKIIHVALGNTSFSNSENKLDKNKFNKDYNSIKIDRKTGEVKE